MKKIALVLGFLLALAGITQADNGPYHSNRVVSSATSVTTTASAWTLLTGSKVEAKKVMISEDSRTLNLKIAFSADDTTTAIASYWLQKPADGVFDQPVKVDPAFGVMVGTTITGSPSPAPTVRLILAN